MIKMKMKLRYSLIIWTILVLELATQTRSFYWTPTQPIQRYQNFLSSGSTGRNVENGGKRGNKNSNPGFEGDRFSFSLNAALSLRETVDVIKESVLLSEIVGNYVKDVQPKGAKDLFCCCHFTLKLYL
jgi:hypothetical protein